MSGDGARRGRCRRFATLSFVAIKRGCMDVGLIHLSTVLINSLLK